MNTRLGLLVLLSVTAACQAAFPEKYTQCNCAQTTFTEIGAVSGGSTGCVGAKTELPSGNADVPGLSFSINAPGSGSAFVFERTANFDPVPSTNSFVSFSFDSLSSGSDGTFHLIRQATFRFSVIFSASGSNVNVFVKGFDVGFNEIETATPSLAATAPFTFTYGRLADGFDVICMAHSAGQVCENVVVKNTNDQSSINYASFAAADATFIRIDAAEDPTTSVTGVLTSFQNDITQAPDTNIATVAAPAPIVPLPLSTAPDLNGVEDILNSFDLNQTAFRSLGGMVGDPVFVITEDTAGSYAYQTGDKDGFDGTFDYTGDTNAFGAIPLNFTVKNNEEENCFAAAVSIDILLADDGTPVCGPTIAKLEVPVGGQITLSRNLATDNAAFDGSTPSIALSALGPGFEFCGTGAATSSATFDGTQSGTVISGDICIDPLTSIIGTQATFKVIVTNHNDACTEVTVDVEVVNPFIAADLTDTNFATEPISPATTGLQDILFSSLGSEANGGAFKIKVLTLPEFGTLQYDGADVTAGQALTGTPDKLVYVLDADENGVITFTYKAISPDNSVESASTGTATLTIAPAEDLVGSITLEESIDVTVGEDTKINGASLVADNNDDFVEHLLIISLDEPTGPVTYKLSGGAACGSCDPVSSSLGTAAQTIQGDATELSTLLNTLTLRAESTDGPAVKVRVELQSLDQFTSLDIKELIINVKEADKELGFFEVEENLIYVGAGCGGFLVLVALVVLLRRSRGSDSHDLDHSPADFEEQKTHNVRGNRESAPNPKNTASIRLDVDDEIFDWEKHIDKESGEVYFFNPKTGESQWDPPTVKKK